MLQKPSDLGGNLPVENPSAWSLQAREGVGERVPVSYLRVGLPRLRYKEQIV